MSKSPTIGSTPNFDLSAYQDKASEDRAAPPEPRDDDASGQHEEVRPPVPDMRVDRDPDAEPTPVIDPRAALAARARARRDEQDEAHSLVGEADPLPEDDGHRDAPRRAPRSPRQSPPQEEPEGGQDRRFSLKVFKNEFSVSKDELLRYAELTPEEADGLPEPSLVRLAQKNLAAQHVLEEAKAHERNTRFAAQSGGAQNQGDQRQQWQQPSGDQEHAPRGSEISDDELDMIQLGDKEEAKATLDKVIARRAEQSVNQIIGKTMLEQRQAEVNREIMSDLEAFSRQRPEFLSDPIINAAHRDMLAREAIEDLRGIGVPEQNLQAASVNPALAMQLYQAARIDGYRTRSPSELFETAAKKVSDRIGHFQNHNAANQRREAKRSIPQTPARSDAGQQQDRGSQEPQNRSPSSVIAEMRRARFQG